MSLKIVVPEVGESITDVTIAAWLKQDGDVVEMDEILCELESEKATFELPAEAEGKLKIVAQEGDTLEIGAVICEIDTEVKHEPSSDDKGSEPDDKVTEKAEEKAEQAATEFSKS